jgi:4-hydroxy-tetrahydrodipicolinate synthase
MSARFGAVITAMATPFDDEGRLDLDVARDLARWLVDNGNDGLVVAGTTGESPTMSDDEKCDLWRAVVEAVDVPIVAGTGSNDTHHTIELTKRAEQCGVAGALVVTPYYNRPSQAGLYGHFRAAAEASSLPVLIYDIPERTGRKVAHETLVRLSGDVPNIVGVKDAVGNVAGAARLVADTPDHFELYSGSSAFTLPLLAVGAVGVIGVASHWTGELHRRMFDAFFGGDVVEAQRINAKLIPSYDFEGWDAAPNPIPTKCMLRLLGLPVGAGRPPMDIEPPGLAEQAHALLRDLGDEAPKPAVPFAAVDG